MDEASIIAPSEAQGDPNDPYAARLEQRQAAGEDVTSISLGERFKRAARAAYEDSLTGRARQLSDVVGGVQNVDEFGIPVGPAPDPADIRRSIEDRHMAAALWESTPGFGNPLEASASLVGGLFGGGISPENWVTRVPGLTSVIERIAPNVAGRVAAAGATQAAVAGASDVIGQAVEVAAGERSDLSAKEASLRAALGFGVGAILHGAGEAVRAVIPKKTPKAIREEVGAAVEAERQVVVTEAVHHAAVQDEMVALAVEDPSLRGEGGFTASGIAQGRLQERPDLPVPSAPSGLTRTKIAEDLGIDVPGTLLVGPDGLKAFHGSPHDFERFSLEHIGTGEGAQAYGHGLYFAEAQGTAESYRDTLTPISSLKDEGEDIANFYLFNALDRETAIRDLEADLTSKNLVPLEQGQGEKALDLLRSGWTRPNGRLYEVRIAAKPEQFLHWDKPLSEQSPAVQAIAERMGVPSSHPGQSLYAALEREVVTGWKPGAPDPREAVDAAKVLREAGIAGIRYLDQSSRAPATDAKVEIAGLEGTLRTINSAIKEQRGILAQTEDHPAYANARAKTTAEIARLENQKAELDARLPDLQAKAAGGTSNYVVFDDNLIHVVAKDGKRLRQELPLADFIKGEAKARLTETLKPTGINVSRLDGTVLDRAAGLADGGHEPALAVERAAITHALEIPAAAAIIRKHVEVPPGYEVHPEAARGNRSGPERGSQAIGAGGGPGEAVQPSGNVRGTGQGDAIQFRKRPTDQSAQPAAAGGAGASTEEPLLTFQEQSAKLAQDLDLTLRQGRLKGGKDTIGQYDPSQDVARVQKITDIRTVAHEAAHGLEGDVPGLPALLTKHKGELGPLDYQVGRNDPREGFAEYLRSFVENPAAAAKAAPQFAAEFRELMQRDAPQALKAFQDARDAYANYLNAPSGAKLDAIMKRQEPEGVWKDLEQHGLPRTVSLYISRFYGTMLDEKNPVAQSVRAIAREWRDASGARPSIEGADNPETLARSWSRAAQAGVSDMRDGVRPYHGTVPEGPSLRDAMIKATGDPGIFGRWNDERMKAFDGYLAARRAEVLWERYDAGDLPNRPVALTKADVASALAELDAAYPSFRDASQMVHDYTRQILRKARDGGLITADLFDELSKEKFYVPLMRDMRDQTQVVGRGAGRDPGQTDLIRRLQGSDRDIISPGQSLMTQTFLVNRTLAHNDIIKALVGLSRSARAAGARNVGRILEEIPAHKIVGKEVNVQEVVRNAAKKAGIDETDTQVLLGSISNTFGHDPLLATFFRAEPVGKGGEPITFWKEGGELRAVRMISKDEGLALYESLNTLPKQLSDVALNFLAMSQTALRAGVTSNPVFAFTNYIRDQLAVSILRPGYVPFLDLVKLLGGKGGIAEEVKQGRLAQMYTYAGGVSPGAGAVGLQDMVDQSINALARKGWAVQKLGTFSDLYIPPAEAVAHAIKGDLKTAGEKLRETSLLSPMKAVAEFVETAETGTRLSVFEKVLKQKKKQGLSDYDAMIEAARQASDLLDFGRHGSGMDYMRTLVAFLNAHMQGLDKARRQLFVPLWRLATGDMVTKQDVDALKSAGASWGLLGISGALGYAYSLWASQHRAYQDANSDLRATHLIVPGAAVGQPDKILVVPKPFELAIGFNLGEMAGLYAATNDPRATEFARSGVMEVLQTPNLIPGKLGAELMLGRSFFTGRDIVPQALKRLVPSEQFHEGTSSFAKKVGKMLAVSPIKVDYAIGAQFGLWGRDLLAASNTADPTAPNASLYDQMFLRRFLKNADTGSETTKTFWDLAAQENGKYGQAKASYERMMERLRDADAVDFLSSLPEAQRAYVILQSAADEDRKLKFSADEKRLHPLTRAHAAIMAVNGYIGELKANTQKEIESGERVTMNPDQRRQLIEQLRLLSAMEQHNALAILGEKGYQGRPLLSTEDQLSVIRAISPVAASEIATRYATSKVLPTASIAKAWPEAQKRLLAEGSAADISDLESDASSDGYAFGGERVTKAKKRRLPISPTPAPVPVSPPPQAPATPQRRSSLEGGYGLNIV
jgi:hypothetical protein